MKLNLELENEELLKQVAKYDQQLMKLDKEMARLLDIRDDGFVKYYKTLKPIIDNMKNKGYYFRHDDVNLVTTKGPIIGKGKYDNKIYCLSFPLVVEVTEGNNGDEKSEHFNRFIRRCDFDFAMKGLNAVEKFYIDGELNTKKSIEQLQNDIEKYGFTKND